MYTAVFTVEGERPILGQYRRTEALSTIVRFGNADFGSSVVGLRLLDDPVGKWNAILQLRPKDRDGNFLGPDYGHQITVEIDPPGEASDERRDLADGNYEIPLRIPSGTDPSITIRVMDEPFYSGPVSKLEEGLRYSLSIHYGYTAPTGSFANAYDGDHSFALDLDYRLNPRLSLIGIVGYNSFQSGKTGIDDTHWWNLSANLRYAGAGMTWTPYIQGGAGAYIPESGSTDPGINFGVGVEYEIDPHWHADVGVDYHHVFTGGTEPQFLLPRVGIIYRY